MSSHSPSEDRSTTETAPDERATENQKKTAGAAEHQVEHEAEEEGLEEGTPLGPRKWTGLFLGPLAFLVMLLIPPPEGLSPAGWHTAAVGLFMAVWWISEAVPIPVTALLPVILFPLVGAGEISETTRPYANDLIFLFLGGFLIATGMERWNLHRRIALTIISVMGTSPRSIVAGFMVAGAFLSMWVSNTATAMMMLPIGLSVVQLTRTSAREQGKEEDYAHFNTVLLLAIAYACSIGGLGTLIGTPPNALLAGFLSETYGQDIGFAQWMLVGVPMMLVGLPLTFFILTYVAFPIHTKELAGGKELIRSELDELGAMSRPEQLVGAVFALTALLWITSPLLERVVPNLDDTSIAIFGAMLLFLIPLDVRRGKFLMTWKAAEDLPWGVLLLFGGGLTLASAVRRNGLDAWIGNSLSGIGFLHILLVIALVVAVIILLTELTSNTATSAAFLPIMASVAVGIGENPFLLIVPAALAASCAFMLPVATPPNAIVYGGGTITIPQMARAGIILNLLFVVLITAMTYLLVPLVFGIDLGSVPGWAAGG